MEICELLVDFSHRLERAGVRIGTLRMQVDEDMYKRLYLELQRLSLYTNRHGAKYGASIGLTCSSGTLQITPDTVDRELNEIWNGHRKVVW